MSPRVLVVDHRDSFVFILAEQFGRLGADVSIYRSGISLFDLQERIRTMDPDLVVLSPGPGRPEDAGVTLSWLATQPTVPVLGICLGHQALALAAGGRVTRGPRPVHGRAFQVRLLDDPLNEGMPETVLAARYHSLVVSEVPSEINVIATAADSGQELVMGLRHRRLPQVGLQFHPESFLTPGGGQWIQRVLDEAHRHRTLRTETPEVLP